MGKEELKKRILEEMTIEYDPLWDLAKEIYVMYLPKLQEGITIDDIYNSLRAWAMATFC